ncbi:TauD/TfdA family dioxygenase [Pseudoalteromonas sp. S2755]|uniref:TauD/TfdA family dioxygenase n=1 Tax=Pseudoalteromonas sp. S2755 TaxID=2066523 RepID=UPI00110BA42A|nr:TauD/TfdA family dioxygenase [Pseudoalteromonas sp. S2755]TMN45128.1 TauD/TfdA family dioxygenase [Pseudoalteromonas sp. S2755]
MSFNKWRNKKSETTTSVSSLVSKVFLEESPTLPIVYKCNTANVDLPTWYNQNESEIAQELAKYGAVLFRGFNIHSEDDFQQFVATSIKQTAKYVEGATPRTKLSKGVYTATEFPSDQEIALHNELSYVTEPPSKLAFCCLTAPESGGQTQLVDVRKVLNRIDRDIVSEFEKREGWLLRRNYGNGYGPTVAKAFGMTDIADIKAYGEKVDLKVTPISDEKVVTEQVRKAVHQHPISGEKVWFNHISFWHTNNLCPDVRAKMQEDLALEDFPYSTRYGDGSDIDDKTVEALRLAYTKEEVKFDWREGDVLLIDNWLVAHGRKPFTGARRVLVAMG